jgi:hypothetical protein
MGGVGGIPGADELPKESKGEGTGEKYIKSSGLKADGGDFDAANPGAGREADRMFFSPSCGFLENRVANDKKRFARGKGYPSRSSRGCT